jgi:hypothetical protein
MLVSALLAASVSAFLTCWLILSGNMNNPDNPKNLESGRKNLIMIRSS